jgi:hypothetical protein
MLSVSRFVAGLPMTGNVLENLERQTAWRRFARWCGYAVVVIVIMGFLPSPSHAHAIAPANPSTAMGKNAASPVKSAKSKECSAQADAKELHGKDRKKFRSQCKAGKS